MKTIHLFLVVLGLSGSLFAAEIVIIPEGLKDRTCRNAGEATGPWSGTYLTDENKQVCLEHYQKVQDILLMPPTTYDFQYDRFSPKAKVTWKASFDPADLKKCRLRPQPKKKGKKIAWVGCLSIWYTFQQPVRSRTIMRYKTKTCLFHKPTTIDVAGKDNTLRWARPEIKFDDCNCRVLNSQSPRGRILRIN